jgi:hypothetical protein
VSQTIHPYTVEDAIKPCEELLMLVVTCSEPDPRIDASHFFNLTAGSNSRIVKTAGGRTGTVANDLYAIDQVTKIGMVVVLQHTGEDPFGCKKSSPGISVHAPPETGEVPALIQRDSYCFYICLRSYTNTQQDAHGRSATLKQMSDPTFRT